MEITIYESGPETYVIDKYTVIIECDDFSAVFTMSENPNDPQGFNQYMGEKSQLDLTNLGKEINYYDLPVAVQKAIAERLPSDEKR